MKKIVVLLLLLHLSIPKSFGNEITLLVDYTITKARIENIKQKYAKIINEKSVLKIKYLGKEGFVKEQSNKFEELKYNCGIDECKELIDFYETNTFNFSCFIREFSNCSSLQDEYNLSTYTSEKSLSKDEWRKLKKSNTILLIDLKGLGTILLPKISIVSSKNEINAGEEVIFKSEFSNFESFNFKNIDWYENDINVEKSAKEYRTIPEEDIEVKCIYVFDDCQIESELLHVEVKKCDNIIPFSLYFDAPEIFSRNSRNENRIYVYPLNNSEASKVLLIKQACYFNEFEIQVLNKEGEILGSSLIQINEAKSNEILQILNIRDKSIRAVDIKEFVDNYKEEFIFIKLIPTKINIAEKNIPKYELFFTSCSPNN